MTNAETTPVDSLALWNLEAPVIPTLDPAARESFLMDAPEGTVVEFHDELYLRGISKWIHLQDLVSAGYSYSDYQEHDTSTPEYLVKSLTSEHTVIRVLRIGEAIGY